MKKTLAMVSAVSVLAVMTAAPAFAAASREVELENVAARVVVTAENRQDVDLKVAYGANSRLPKIMVHMEGAKLVADGKLKMRGLQCQGADAVKINGIGVVTKAELPVIYIKVPMDADVSVGGASFGQIGATSTLDFSQGGCGNWTVGDVAGKAEINIGGSGDVNAGDTRDLEVNIGGSGNFRGKSVAALEANIGGNGDIELARINGRAEINIGGSGNVSMTDGQVSKLQVNIAGSGDVRFGGEAKDVEVNIVGSGDVRVKKVSGNIQRSIMGSGNVIVGQ